MGLEKSGNYNMGNQATDTTWQCWMVNIISGKERLIAHGYQSESECKAEASRIFAEWDVDPYPSNEGWTVVYRQDSALKMAQYWHYRNENEKALQELNQYNPPTQQSPPQQLNPIPEPKKLRRRRRVRKQAITALGGGYKRVLKLICRVGLLCVGTLFFAIAPEVPALLKPPKSPQYSTQHITDIPLSIRELFKDQKAPGAIAVGVAEGNLTPSGKPTSNYLSGHTDPGNFATNRGFCSWNQANGISLEEADRRCIESLQTKSVATENQMLELGLNPEKHKKAIIIASDLWNQSNTAGPKFPFTYKAALEKGFEGQQAYIWARVEAFRNRLQQLDASGLFGICRREPYYRQQLIGLIADSEEWRWNCIKLDQMRRILEIETVLPSNFE